MLGSVKSITLGSDILRPIKGKFSFGVIKSNDFFSLFPKEFIELSI